MKNKQTKLYGLFAAVNDYQYISGLTGCRNDADNLHQYLKKATKAQGMEIVDLKLYDSNATKNNLKNKILSHLGQAGKEDICLFYFAGHGGQEIANDAFLKHESDGKLEVLACYDSDLQKQGSFLADKELRYLIRQLYEQTEAQIITIFDCCHSGTNTRSTQVVRRLMSDAVGRNWEDFIFSKKIKAKTVKEAFDLETVLPQGKHLHLAACEAHQQAQELVNIGGVFTSNLVNILEQTKGKISYRGLVSAIRKKIPTSYEQNPQLYAKGDKQFIFQDFLGGITSHQRLVGKLNFDTTAAVWVLDIGALQGIKKSNLDLNLEILGANNKPIGKAIIDKVLLDKTEVLIPSNMKLKLDEIYKVSISGLVVDKLSICPMGEKAGMNKITEYFRQNHRKIEGVQLVNNQALADYLVKAIDGTYQICLPSNGLTVTENVDGYDKLSTLINYLEQIAYWTFIKNLKNENVPESESLPVKSSVFLTDTDGVKEDSLDIEKNKLTTQYDSIPVQGQPTINLKIKLTNDTNQPYYCALLFLSQDFGIINDFVEGQTIRLEPKAIQWAEYNDEKVITLGQEDYIKHYNWPKETSYLKLIISQDFFDISKLVMEALPAPEVTRTMGIQQRGIQKINRVTPPEWMSQLITLELENPYYDEQKATAHMEELMKKR